MKKLIVTIFVIGVTAFITKRLFDEKEILIAPKSNETNYSKQRDEAKIKKVTKTFTPHKVMDSRENRASDENENSEKNQENKNTSERNLTGQSENKAVYEANLTDNLHIALSNIPDTYHSIFQWPQGVDNEIVDEYANASANQELQSPDTNIERLFSDFVYRHELSSKITIEVLRCTSSSCEVYGREFSSNTWGVIKEEAKQTSWWPFSIDTTRVATGKNGEMVFLTITRK